MFLDIFTRVKIGENRLFDGIVGAERAGLFFDVGRFRRTLDSADAIGFSRVFPMLSFRLT